MLRLCVAATLAIASLGSVAQDRGLRLERPAASPWAASLESVAPSAWAARSTSRASVRLLGDYRLGELRFGSQSLGALRISGGLLYGPAGQVVLPLAGYTPPSGLGPSSTDLRLGATDLRSHATWSYLGLGYAASLGAFGLHADLGMAATNPTAPNLGRLGDAAGWDSLVRDLRLTPVLRLGMTYRF